MFSAELLKFMYITPTTATYMAERERPLILVADGCKMLLMKRFDLLHSFELTMQSRMTYKDAKFGAVLKNSSGEHTLKFYFKSQTDAQKFVAEVKNVIRIGEKISCTPSKSMESQHEQSRSSGLASSVSTLQPPSYPFSASLQSGSRETATRKLDEFLADEPTQSGVEPQKSAAFRNLTQQFKGEQTQTQSTSLATEVNVFDKKEVDTIVNEFGSHISKFLERLLTEVMERLDSHLKNVPRVHVDDLAQSFIVDTNGAGNATRRKRKKPKSSSDRQKVMKMLNTSTYWPGFFDGAKKPRKGEKSAEIVGQSSKRRSALNASSRITMAVQSDMKEIRKTRKSGPIKAKGDSMSQSQTKNSKKDAVDGNQSDGEKSDGSEVEMEDNGRSGSEKQHVEDQTNDAQA